VVLPDFPLVDAHVHLYDPDALDYPWMAGDPLLNTPHGSPEYTAAIGGVAVDKLVFVEVDVASGRHLDEVVRIESVARSDARVQAIVAAMPLELGAAAEPDVAAFARMPLARGVRRLIQGHVDEPGWCLRPDFVAGVKLLEKYELGFEICIYHPQMADAIELVRRCPQVSFILDHIGKPGIRDGLREPWWRQMRQLASLPNVVCKVSGVVTEADHRNWTYDQVAPYVAHAIECFGFDRVAFGGDWPVMERATRYSDWVAVVDQVTAGASPAELRQLYRDTAIAHYRL
jgi:L-fuconolactonase